MEFIKSDDASKEDNSEVCKLSGYSFVDKSIDLAVTTITGRYPDKGHCVHLVSKELVYIIEGSGRLCFEGKSVEFSAGDSILIDKGEKYYWETEYCKTALVCTPAWRPEQYRLID